MSVKSKLTQGGDGTAIPAGMVGEVKAATAIGTSVTIGTSDTTITDITLNKGRWQLFWALVVTNAPATTFTYDYVGLTNSGGAHIAGTWLRQLAYPASVQARHLHSNSIVVDVVADGTVYYLKGNKADSGTGSIVIVEVAADVQPKMYAVLLG